MSRDLSERRPARRRFALPVAVATLLLILLAVPIAGASVGDADRPDEGANATITEGLESADGTVEVLVRLEEPTRADQASEVSTQDRLRAHAEQSQEPLVTAAERRNGVTVKNRFWLVNAVLLEVDTDRVPLEEIAAVEGVTELAANQRIYARSLAVDVDGVAEIESGPVAGTEPIPVKANAFETTSDVETTWGLAEINAPDVWDTYDTRGEGVKVAVLDTGVDAEHVDISLYTEDPDDPTYPGGWAEFDDDGNEVEGSEPHDTATHGTHVSGTVAGGNASGTHVGVAPDADLMHGLVLPDGSGSLAQVIAGMEWAIEEDVDVITLSLGIDDYVPEFIEAIDNAEKAETLVVAAVGNDEVGTSNSPGNVYESFAAGASNSNGEIADFSSGETIVTNKAWGDSAPDDWPDEYVVPNVAAPGVWINSTVPENAYDLKSGTSMATPHVSGAAALLLSLEPDLTPAEVRSTFEKSAWKPDGESEEQDTRYGHGIIDAKAAVDALDYNGTVTGTVTGEGESAAGVTIETDDGHATTTDGNGTYSLSLEPGEHELTADGFGLEAERKTVEVESGTTRTANFDLARTLDSAVTGQPASSIDGGESFETTVGATAFDAVSVDLANGSTVDRDDLLLRVEDVALAFGDPISYETLQETRDLGIAVETAHGANGTAALEFTATDGENATTVSTDEVDVNRSETAVDLTDAFEANATPGTTVHATANATEAGSMTVDLAAGSTVDPAETTLRADGEEVGYGEAFDVNETRAGDEIPLEIETTENATGTLRLAASLNVSTVESTVDDDSTAFSSTTTVGTAPPRYVGTSTVNGESTPENRAVFASVDDATASSVAVEDGRFGYGDTYDDALVVDGSPESNVSFALERAETGTVVPWSEGDVRVLDLDLEFEDVAADARLEAPPWIETNETASVSLENVTEPQYVHDVQWTREDLTPEDGWNATHAFDAEDEGTVDVEATVVDLGNRTASVSTSLLVVDGSIATVSGHLDVANDSRYAVGVAPDHGRWTYDRSVEGSESFAVPTQQNNSAHVVLLGIDDRYPHLETLLLEEPTDDVDLGTVTPSAGHPLEIDVVDEDGDGVENATVRVWPASANVTNPYAVDGPTNESGAWTGPTGNEAGVSANGTVTVSVTPPDGEDFLDEVVVRELAVETDTELVVELESESGDDDDGGGALPAPPGGGGPDDDDTDYDGEDETDGDETNGDDDETDETVDEDDETVDGNETDEKDEGGDEIDEDSDVDDDGDEIDEDGEPKDDERDEDDESDPNDESSEDDSDETEDGSDDLTDGVPGFGVLAGLLAVSALVALSVRRHKTS